MPCLTSPSTDTSNICCFTSLLPCFDWVIYLHFLIVHKFIYTGGDPGGVWKPLDSVKYSNQGTYVYLLKHPFLKVGQVILLNSPDSWFSVMKQDRARYVTMPVLGTLGPVCRECCQWWGRLLPPGVGTNLLGGTWHPVTRGNSEISPHDLPSFPRDVPKEHWMLQARCALGGGQAGNGGWESKWPSGLPCGCWVLVGAQPCHATWGKAAGDSKKEWSPSATKTI